jgi:CRISPR-associated protein Cas2
MLFYVVSYDIPCDKRRKKVSNLLEGYGKRVQYSVFECAISQSKYDELLQRLRRQVKFDEDSLRFYPVSGHTFSQVEVWGGVPVTTAPGSVVI